MKFENVPPRAEEQWPPWPQEEEDRRRGSGLEGGSLRPYPWLRAKSSNKEALLGISDLNATRFLPFSAEPIACARSDLLPPPRERDPAKISGEVPALAAHSIYKK